MLGSKRRLSKPQRRGAIIILGMMAVAKRGVVTDKVDIMLKYGLGLTVKVFLSVSALLATLIEDVTDRFPACAIYLRRTPTLKRQCKEDQRQVSYYNFHVA